MRLPMPVFRPHMYVVATIKKYDRATGTYDLEYSSGPYLADENPTGIHLFKGPAGAHSVFHLKGVKQSLITVGKGLVLGCACVYKGLVDDANKMRMA
jgi:hypothetical protein